MDKPRYHNSMPFFVYLFLFLDAETMERHRGIRGCRVLSGNQQNRRCYPPSSVEDIFFFCGVCKVLSRPSPHWFSFGWSLISSCSPAEFCNTYRVTPLCKQGVHIVVHAHEHIGLIGLRRDIRPRGPTTTEQNNKQHTHIICNKLYSKNS